MFNWLFTIVYWLSYTIAVVSYTVMVVVIILWIIDVNEDNTPVDVAGPMTHYYDVEEPGFWVEFGDLFIKIFFVTALVATVIAASAKYLIN